MQQPVFEGYNQTRTDDSGDHNWGIPICRIGQLWHNRSLKFIVRSLFVVLLLHKNYLKIKCASS